MINAKAANTKTLQDLFMAELADMYDAEHRIVKASPKLAQAATCDPVKDTDGQVTNLD